MAERAAEASVDIDAPIDEVWRVVTDLRAYASWNPFIVEVTDPPPLAVGATLQLRVRWQDGGEERPRERIVRIEPPVDDGAGARRAVFAYRFVSWMHTIGMIRATRVQVLTQRAGEPVRYETREAFTGWGARGVPLAKVRAGFDAHARALKAKCES